MTSDTTVQRENRRMSDDEILSIVQGELDSSLGWTGARLAESRRRTMSEYLGLPRGDEREGFSQVTTRETFEQVEQLLPSLMEMFTSSSEVVEFKPESEDDVEAAKQATDAVNWIFRKEDGFMVLYTAFKDALIQKNGIGKVTWDGGTEGIQETYEGKGYDEFLMLIEDPSFIVKQVTARMMTPEGEQVEFAEGEMPEEYAMLAEYDVVGVRVNTGRVRLENVPPEEFFLNRDARSLSLRDPTVRFIGHRVRTTASQLKGWGYDPNQIDNLPTAGGMPVTSQDSIVRSALDDGFTLDSATRRDAERAVYINDVYLKLDRDNDGISEWWRVVCGGSYGEALLSIEPADGHPFFAMTPIPIPHRFYGLGIADVVSDIQNRSTTLERQRFDSLYLSIAPRNIVEASGQGETATPLVNLEQLYSAVPGSHIEEYKSGALRPYVHQSNAADVVPAQELLRTSMIHRTGVNPEAAATDPGAISKHVYGAMVQQGATQQRLGLYARIFADTGVRDMFQLIYKMLCQHQVRPMMVRLRGKWETVDPSSWSHQMDCEISVGLGRGSRMEKLANLQSVATIMESVGEKTSLVSERHMYNLMADLTETMGFRNPTRYVDDPEDPERPPPPEPAPDPAMVALEYQRESDAMKLELERQKLELEREKVIANVKRMELEHEVKILQIRAGNDPAPGAPFDAPWSLPVPGAAPAPMPMPGPMPGPMPDPMPGPVPGPGPGPLLPPGALSQ